MTRSDSETQETMDSKAVEDCFFKKMSLQLPQTRYMKELSERSNLEFQIGMEYVPRPPSQGVVTTKGVRENDAKE